MRSIPRSTKGWLLLMGSLVWCATVAQAVESETVPTTTLAAAGSCDVAVSGNTTGPVVDHNPSFVVMPTRGEMVFAWLGLFGLVRVIRRRGRG